MELSKVLEILGTKYVNIHKPKYIYVGEYMNVKYAIKIIKIKKVEIRNRVINEIKILQILKEYTIDNIVSIIESFDFDNYMVIVTNFIEGDDMVDYNYEDYNNIKLLKIVYEIVKTIKKLHDLRIIHGDIKLDNIMYDGTKIILVDFGFSRYDDDFESKCMGSVNYTPIEVFNQNVKCQKSVDIHCLGITIYVLLSHKFPYHGANDRDYILNVTNKLVLPDMIIFDTSTDVKLNKIGEVIMKMIDKDWNNRPNIDEIISVLEDHDEILNKTESLKMK